MVILPIVHAMVICDGVYQETTTGKCTVLGTFSDISSRVFPVIHPVMFVFVQMTDIQGQVPIRLRMVRVVPQAPGEVEEFRTPDVVVTVPSPLEVVEISIRLSGVRFDQPGEYRIQLVVRGHTAHERKLTVRQVP